MIVSYTHQYLQDVFKLLCQLWPDRKMDINTCKKVLERGMNSGNQVYKCALENEKVVGFCSLTITNSLLVGGPLAFIDELVIDESCRGKGIGKALLRDIENEARLRFCNNIELISAFRRQSAHIFYEKKGFNKSAFLFEKKLK